MAFRVGQKVTPKNAKPWEDEFSYEIFPQFGVVYTVRACEWNNGEQFIWLAEIINQPAEYEEGLSELNFFADEFRPVVERKTDISVFTAMLTGSKIGADA